MNKIFNIIVICFIAFIISLFIIDYNIAVDKPGDIASPENLSVFAFGACPVCGSINTISEGLYYFKEEAFDSTLTWGIPYKQFRKIYCSKCGVGRLIDYNNIKDIELLNESIKKDSIYKFFRVVIYSNEN